MKNADMSIFSTEKKTVKEEKSESSHLLNSSVSSVPLERDEGTVDLSIITEQDHSLSTG